MILSGTASSGAVFCSYMYSFPLEVNCGRFLSLLVPFRNTATYRHSEQNRSIMKQDFSQWGSIVKTKHQRLTNLAFMYLVLGTDRVVHQISFNWCILFLCLLVFLPVAEDYRIPYISLHFVSHLLIHYLVFTTIPLLKFIAAIHNSEASWIIFEQSLDVLPNKVFSLCLACALVTKSDAIIDNFSS